MTNIATPIIQRSNHSILYKNQLFFLGSDKSTVDHEISMTKKIGDQQQTYQHPFRTEFHPAEPLIHHKSMLAVVLTST